MTKVKELEKDIWKDDKLDIRENVIGFANILKQEKFVEGGSSKVYAISAEFGIGKTFFCEKLAKALEQDKVPVSILNIWEMDFYENPLLPILVTLQETYRASNTKDKKIPTKILNWFKSGLSGVSVKASIPKLGEVCIDGEKMVNCNEKLNDKLQENDIYTAYKHFKTELDNLKDFLRNWAKKLNTPVVVIIDELDRCRPDYAVKTLEILKHFFDIPGFVFVLAIAEEQLKSSVETLFGTKNFDGYKRKFINNSFILPNPDKEKFTNFLYEKSGLSNIVKQIEENNKDLVFKIRRDSYQDYINRCFFGENNIKEIANCRKFNEQQTMESIIKRHFTAYSIWFKFNLRQMEQVFDRLTLFSKEILGSDMLFSPDLAVLLVCLHEFDLTLYSKLKKKGFIGYSDHLLSLIIGTQTSIAFKIYDKSSFDMVDKIDRDLMPECPQIPDFSILADQSQTRIVIHDNVERFFIQDPDNPLKWLRDAVIDNQKNPIDNNCRIGVIVRSKSNAGWVEPEPDINTESKFDLEKFRKDYFAKMDFISKFN